MKTLQALATSDQVSAIKREANEKYDLMDHCLSEREWEGAANLLDRANRLMALAARLEMRQSVLVAAEGIPTISGEHNAINVAVRELMQ